MGRFFSTVYRFVIVVVSVSALVLSIISATSCAFVKFEHEYKSSGRYLLDSDVNNDAALVVGDGGSVGLERELQDPADGASGPASGGELSPESNLTAPEQSDTDSDSIADESPDETEEQITVGTGATLATTAATDLTLLGKTEDLAASSPAEAAATEVPVPSPGDTPFPSPFPSSGFAEASEAPVPSAPAAPTDTNEGASASEFTGIPTVTNEGASASEFTGTAEGASAPAATAAGHAGLYCNGEQSFSVTNLWGQTVEELAEELGDMSDFNQSEEIARGAAVTACVFGLVGAFVLIMESIIGWRMCCERLIVGFVAIVACVSQGLTFLFFNSERYCDGDIVNEILNQEPCVVGQGGLLSALAITAYAVIAIMACRLPQDDPYGLCCKKRSAARNEGSARGSASGGGSKFAVLGKSNGGGPDTANSPEERDRPDWLSEDARKQKEENEII